MSSNASACSGFPSPPLRGRLREGLDFLGDVDELRENLEAHYAISNLFGGYKISLHSGSDNFSIYPLAVAAIGGLVHLKPSGTSYLGLPSLC